MAKIDYSGAPDVSARLEAPEDEQHIQANPAAFGSELAQGEEKLGAGIIDANKFYGTVAADNSTNNTLEQVTAVLHGDPGKPVMGADGQMVPDTGFFGKRGADAMSAAPEVQHRIDEIIRENRSSLSDPQAQYQYDVDSRRYRAQWLNEVGTHTDQEQKTWATDTNNTQAQLALNAIARKPTDATTIATNMALVRRSYVRNAQLAGLDAGGAQLKADQEVELARIRSLIVSDPQSAQKVLEASQGVLGSRPDYDSISRGVKEAVINSQLGPATIAAVNAAKMQASTMVGQPQRPGTVSAAALTEDQAAAAITGAFPGAVITSGARSPQHNAEVGGVPDSQHLSANAVDFVLPKGTTFDQVKATMQAHGMPASELINEGTHIHWAWGQKGQGGETYPSTIDAIRGNMDKTLTQAQADAARMFPNYPDAQERYVEGVRRGLDQTISQQEMQVQIDTHVVQQALASDHPPISEEQLKSLGPQVAMAWNNVQMNNAYAAMHIENVFDANAKGKAAGLGTQFTTMMDRVLAPVGDPSRITNAQQLWPYVEGGEGGPLTNTGLGRLNDMLAMRGTPHGDAQSSAIRTFFQQAHTQLSAQNPELGFYDPVGEKNFQAFLIQALPTINAEMAAGKPLAQIIAPKGDVYNSIFTFKRPMGKDLQDRILDTNRVSLGSITGDKVVLDPVKSAMIDKAVQAKQFTPEQAAQVKGLMLDVQTRKLTPAQAKQRGQQLGLFPPDVPLPGGP